MTSLGGLLLIPRSCCRQFLVHPLAPFQHLSQHAASYLRLDQLVSLRPEKVEDLGRVSHARKVAEALALPPENWTVGNWSFRLSFLGWERSENT